MAVGVLESTQTFLRSLISVNHSMPLCTVQHEMKQRFGNSPVLLLRILASKMDNPKPQFGFLKFWTTQWTCESACGRAGCVHARACGCMFVLYCHYFLPNRLSLL